MPQAINYSERIEYLVRRCFPNAAMLRVTPSIRNPSLMPDMGKLREAVNAYRGELGALTFAELATRFEEEKRKEGKEEWRLAGLVLLFTRSRAGTPKSGHSAGIRCSTRTR